MSQFVCPIDGEGFDQKSRYERHLASAHPRSALTAADLEHALAGINFPLDKPGLVAFAESRLPLDSGIMEALRSLPDRTYRDAAEAGNAWGEVKARQPNRASMEFTSASPPSSVGGRVASTAAVSPAAVAKVLEGVDFPCFKRDLVNHARQYPERVENPSAIIDLIDRLPDRRYTKMAEVETEVGKIL